MKERSGTVLVLLLGIVLSSVFMDILPASGAINKLNDYANRTLTSLDKNLTHIDLTTAITQLNNSEFASDPDDARLYKEVAKNHINDLKHLLSDKSNHRELDPTYDEKICTDNPYDCTIADLELVLFKIDHGDKKDAMQTLQKLYNQTR